MKHVFLFLNLSHQQMNTLKTTVLFNSFNFISEQTVGHKKVIV